MRRTLHLGLLAVLAFGFLRADSCDQNLLDNPGFDLWCGEALCGWEVEEGAVARSATWHERDYGVALVGDQVSLSQLANRRAQGGACIGLDLLADRDEQVQLTLELDFLDDGEVEVSHAIGTQGFAPLRYRVRAPEWFGSLRFRIRKQGSGKAVLAQIQAFVADDCEAPAVELAPRPLGAPCALGDDCASGLCGPREGVSGAPSGTCAECVVDEACPGEEICAPVESRYGRGLACAPAGSDPMGAACERAIECAAGSCAEVEPGRGVCARCDAAQGCGEEGEACGLDLGAAGALEPGCGAAARHVLGERCLGDVECATGTCCEGRCSTCCEDAGCAGDQRCARNEQAEQMPAGPSVLLWYLALPLQCAAGEGQRAAGEPCLVPGDCASGSCVAAGRLLVCSNDGRPCALEELGEECPDEAGICLELGARDGHCD